MSEVEHLILSSTLDFSTDYVCYEMNKRGVSYLRLNRDRFLNYLIRYRVESGNLEIKIGENTYIIEPKTLKSVFFRAPVYIRTNKAYSVEMQLYRSQWSSFIRNLTVFSKAKWLNHPMYTYQAENKMYQLDIAQKLGLKIPDTVISNDSQGLCDDCLYVVKALDTPLYYENNQELFTYSTVSTGKDIKQSSLKEAPVIIQNCLQPKIDLRVTVVGKHLFPVSITKNNQGISGDWRKTKKEDLQYKPVEIPKEISEKLLDMMSYLNLSFGGIDLAFSKGEYFFIEVNPTGEWGWLVRTAGLDIHKAIVDWMVN